MYRFYIIFFTLLLITPCIALASVSLEIVGSTTDPITTDITSMDYNEGYLYTISATSNISAVFDVSDSGTMDLVSTISNPGFNYTFDVEVVNNHAYYTSIASGEIYIYDIQDPPNPVGAGVFTDPSLATPAFIDSNDTGTLLYVFGYNSSGDGAFYVLDISNPLVPTIRSLVTDPTFQFINSMAVSGTTVFFVTSDDDLIRIDASDSYNPAITNIYNDGLFMTNITSDPHLFADSNYIYLATSSPESIVIIDTTDPYILSVAGVIPSLVGISIPLGEHLLVADSSSNDIIAYDIGTVNSILQASILTDPLLEQSAVFEMGDDDIVFLATQPLGLTVIRKVISSHSPSSRPSSSLSHNVGIRRIIATLRQLLKKQGVTSGCYAGICVEV